MYLTFFHPTLHDIFSIMDVTFMLILFGGIGWFSGPVLHLNPINLFHALTQEPIIIRETPSKSSF